MADGLQHADDLIFLGGLGFCTGFPVSLVPNHRRRTKKSQGTYFMLNLELFLSIFFPSALIFFSQTPENL